MSARSRALFAEVVRTEPVDVGLAALLIATEAEPSLDLDEQLAALDDLATSVPTPDVAGLRLALGGFSGSEEDFGDLRASLLPEVLRRRHGLPLLLSVVWAEVAARRGIPAYYCTLPGRVVIAIGDPEDEHVVVDPYRGGAVVDEPAEPLSALELLLRLLTNIRLLMARQAPTLEGARVRLWAVELSLLLPSHPLTLRRERGELLVRLGSHLLGAEELEAYADVVPEEDVAEKCRLEARQARARLN